MIDNNAKAMVVDAFMADALALGAHWIFMIHKTFSNALEGSKILCRRVLRVLIPIILPKITAWVQAGIESKDMDSVTDLNIRK